jgi:integrase
MATFIKRAGGWRVEIRRTGLPYRSATFRTKAEATAWAVTTEAELTAGRRGVIVPRTVAAALQRYAREASPGHKGARWELLRLAKLERELGVAGMLLEDVRPADIAAWRMRALAGVRDAAGAWTRRPLAGASVRREMGLLHGVFELARREWGWLRVNPMDGVERPRHSPARERIYLDDEVAAIVAALGHLEGTVATTTSARVGVAFLWALETAMRAGELCGLTWPAIVAAERYARLPETKNGDARRVPLSRRALELLEVLPRDRATVFDLARLKVMPDGTRLWVPQSSVDVLFRRARDRAGVMGATFHDSRATALTRLATRLDVLELARMVGHRDPRSLMVYYRATPATIAAKLD